MIGAIAGDMIGSLYEFDENAIKTTGFPLWQPASSFTDDTIMTIAVASALMHALDAGASFQDELVKSMREFGRAYPDAGYGTRFINWLHCDDPQPYNSWGNGSAMRVSPIGWAFDTLSETLDFAEASSVVTHDHPEGVRGAQATAAAIFLARTGKSTNGIRTWIRENLGYDFSRTLDQIRPAYHHVESCQESVPESLTAFFESSSFEDAIRKAVSLGGDADTMACICGSVAEAYYGIPEAIARETRNRLDSRLLGAVDEWNAWLEKRRVPRHRPAGGPLQMP